MDIRCYFRSIAFFKLVYDHLTSIITALEGACSLKGIKKAFKEFIEKTYGNWGGNFYTLSSSMKALIFKFCNIKKDPVTGILTFDGKGNWEDATLRDPSGYEINAGRYFAQVTLTAFEVVDLLMKAGSVLGPSANGSVGALAAHIFDLMLKYDRMKYRLNAHRNDPDFFDWLINELLKDGWIIPPIEKADIPGVEGDFDEEALTQIITPPKSAPTYIVNPDGTLELIGNPDLSYAPPSDEDGDGIPDDDDDDDDGGKKELPPGFYPIPPPRPITPFGSGRSITIH